MPGPLAIQLLRLTPTDATLHAWSLALGTMRECVNAEDRGSGKLCICCPKGVAR